MSQTVSEGGLQMPSVQEVASVRARLWDSGFRPVAVYNPVIGEENTGKNPAGDKWQLKARRDTPEAVSSRVWSEALNTGILCDGLRAIDIDIEDAEVVEKIKAAILSRWGETPIRYRDNSPRVLIVYRSSEGEPPKRVLASDAGKIEVLGLGQQFVAFGVHWTGAPLRWVGEPPGDVALDQIPTVSEDDVTKLFAFAAPLIGSKGE